MVCYDLDLWPRNLVHGHWTSFTKMNYVGEVWARVDQRKKIYDSDKDFIQRHSMDEVFISKLD